MEKLSSTTREYRTFANRSRQPSGVIYEESNCSRDARRSNARFSFGGAGSGTRDRGFTTRRWRFRTRSDRNAVQSGTHAGTGVEDLPAMHQQQATGSGLQEL